MRHTRTDLRTNSFIILDEVKLEVVKFPNGKPMVFRTAKDANDEASRQMLDLWDIHHLDFFHPHVQHKANFVHQEHPVPEEGEFSKPLMEFFEEAELMFRDFPGGRRFVIQTIREDRNVTARLRELGVPTEHIFEIMDLAEQGKINIQMTDGFLHMTVNKDSLTFDREPDPQMFETF